MFLKLLKLLLKSRYTKGYLSIILLVFFYSIITGSVGEEGGYSFYSVYYLAFIFGLFTVSATLFGGISTTSADRNFLLTSPVKSRDLIPAFFIVQAVNTSILFIAASFGGIIETAKNITSIYYDIIGILIFSVFPISMSINYYDISLKYKLVTAVLEVIWIGSSFFNFKYGAISFITNGSIVSIYLLLTVFIISMAFSSYRTRSEELPFRLNDIRIRKMKEVYKSEKTFRGKSSTLAVFLFHFKYIDLSSRVATQGNLRIRVSRVKFYIVPLITSVISIILFLIIFGRIPFVHFSMASKGDLSLFELGFLESYVAWSLSLAMGSGLISRERAWLGFSSMDFRRYLLICTSAKFLQGMIGSLPIFIMNMTAYFLTSKIYFLYLAFIFIISVPEVSALVLLLNVNKRAFQITSEDVLPRPYSMGQFLFFGTSFVVLFVLIFETLLTQYDFYDFAVIFLVLIVLISMKNYWNEKLYDMIEDGYV
ncbi:hypothetical protein [Caldiplasma sukawensis]